MESVYCGLKCNECPVYQASVSRNTAEQQKFYWNTRGFVIG